MTVSLVISRRFVRAPRGRPLFIPALYTVKNQDAVLNADTSSSSETATVPAAVIAQKMYRTRDFDQTRYCDPGLYRGKGGVPFSATSPTMKILSWNCRGLALPLQFVV
ncbi:hypothetical protein SLA2020_431150 [Shorea laevis]